MLEEAHALSQAPVIETEVPTQDVIEEYAGAQVGGSNPETPEGEGVQEFFLCGILSKASSLATPAMY